LIKIDFIIRKETAYRQEEFLRRQSIRIDDCIVWIVSAEDLLLSKLIWAKESHSEMQFNDIRNLIISVQHLDWYYINHWASQLTVINLLNELR